MVNRGTPAIASQEQNVCRNVWKTIFLVESSMPSLKPVILMNAANFMETKAVDVFLPRYLKYVFFAIIIHKFLNIA